jgi:hypothetical protein
MPRYANVQLAHRAIAHTPTTNPDWPAVAVGQIDGEAVGVEHPFAQDTPGGVQWKTETEQSLPGLE